MIMEDISLRWIIMEQVMNPIGIENHVYSDLLHRKFVHPQTKLRKCHAYALPCGDLGYVDSDGLVVRNPFSASAFICQRDVHPSNSCNVRSFHLNVKHAFRC